MSSGKISIDYNNKYGLFIIIVLLSLVCLAGFSQTRFVIVIFSIVVINVLLHLSGFVITGYICGTQVENLEIFYGNKIVKIHIGHLTISIGTIPFGGSVIIKGMNAFSEEIDNGIYLPLAKRLSILISGPLILLILAMVCIGPQEAWRSLVSGFSQMLLGAFSPLTLGQELIGKAVEYYQMNGFISTLGVLSTKIASFNLLPIPPMNGGKFIIEPFRFNKSTTTLIHVLGYLIGLLIAISWLIAIFQYALNILK